MDAKTPLIGGSALADPFYTIKDVLEGDIRALRSRFDEWQARGCGADDWRSRSTTARAAQRATAAAPPRPPPLLAVAVKQRKHGD